MNFKQKVISILILWFSVITLSAQSYTQEQQQVLQIVNQERKNAGRKPVRLNPYLNAAALAHSEDMKNNDFFSHTGSDGSSFGQRAQRAGYEGSPRGENIAWGYSSPSDVMQGWMTSPGHRNNILGNGHNEMGIAKVGRYWTQVFGRGDQTLSTPEIQADTKTAKLIVSPNPTRDLISLAYLSEKSVAPVEVTVMDITGKVIIKKELSFSGTKNATVDLSGFPAGLYVLSTDRSPEPIKIMKI